jgi:hypothetical protein
LFPRSFSVRSRGDRMARFAHVNMSLGERGPSGQRVHGKSGAAR